jgi:uncharacterized protein (DUF58 family)
MTPSLALRGRLIVATGALFAGIGALSPEAWPLVALGTVILAALCSAYIWFYPTAIYLRRHKVELAWWVPPGEQPGGALTVDHPFNLHMALRNRGGRPLRVLEAKVFASSALGSPQPVRAVVAPGNEVEVVTTLAASACGHWVLHGASVKIGDLLGLFELRAYFPNPITVKVFPKLGSPRQGQVLRPQVGALHERIGVHTIRRRGLAGDLREIREHAHGDAFKFIAWKATARKRRLMVRELESEIVVTHQLLLDISGTMRATGGRGKLDYGIEVVSALARAALEGGDRVGLVTFDTRVFQMVKPGEGRPHFLKCLDRLVETKNVVDGDLTELGDGELVAAVARYMLHQEGVDARLGRAPPVDDPAWAKIAVGPRGELYDLASLGQLIGVMLRNQKQRVPEADGKDRNPEIARLRTFCRARGIEIPYRALAEPGKRAAGLAQALARVTHAERSQFVLVVSDLEGVLDDPGVALKAISLARQRRHHLVVVAPFGPAFLPPARTEAGRRVAEVIRAEEERRQEAARRLLVGAGVPVISAGPDDNPAVLARKMARQPQRRA